MKRCAFFLAIASVHDVPAGASAFFRCWCAPRFGYRYGAGHAYGYGYDYGRFGGYSQYFYPAYPAYPTYQTRGWAAQPYAGTGGGFMSNVMSGLGLGAGFGLASDLVSGIFNAL